MIEHSSKPPEPRRRWFQYSLRTLLLLFFVANVILAWFTVRMHNANRQHRAVAAISNLGGVVTFDDDPDDLTMATPKSSVPGWLRRLLGDDFFHCVTGATVFNDASMAAVGDLPNLRRLNFVGTPGTDAGLVYVERLAQLERLNVSDTQITDSGLTHLQGLAQLRELCLRGTGVSAAAVDAVQRALPQCKIER